MNYEWTDCSQISEEKDDVYTTLVEHNKKAEMDFLTRLKTSRESVPYTGQHTITQLNTTPKLEEKPL